MNPFETCRKAAGLTQEKAALSLGVDRSTVAKWETGKAKPTFEKLIRIVQLYRCTVDDLIEIDESATRKLTKEEGA